MEIRMQTRLMLKTFDQHVDRVSFHGRFCFPGGNLECRAQIAGGAGDTTIRSKLLPRYVSSRGTRSFPSGMPEGMRNSIEQQTPQYRSNGRNYQGISMVWFLLPKCVQICEIPTFLHIIYVCDETAPPAVWPPAI
jgi:hypothetical protein